ncbi:hypothetical protein Rruber_05383 (plasmid) [Rhodococcus ruber]
MRVSGVSVQHALATKIRLGKVFDDPGYRSLPRHHGEAETGGYVLTGIERVYFGENFGEYVDLTEGDFVFAPPFMSHVEANMSTTEELIRLTTRPPETIVVNLPEVDDSVLTGYVRVGAPPEAR